MNNLNKIKKHSIENTIGKEKIKLKKQMFPDNYYSYDIHRHLQTDFHNISIEKGEKIHICCFRIVKSRQNKIISNAFLEYLLYKYPNNKKTIENLCVFPFTKYKSGTLLSISKILTKK